MEASDQTNVDFSLSNLSLVESGRVRLDYSSGHMHCATFVGTVFLMTYVGPNVAWSMPVQWFTMSIHYEIALAINPSKL